jgi:hypothetical protein
MFMAINYTDATDTDFKGENYNIDIGKPLSAAGMREALHTKEKVENKITAIDSSSTDEQYPSAKAVYASLDGTNNNLVHKTENEAITGTKTFSGITNFAEPKFSVAKTTDAANDGTKIASEAQVYKVKEAVQSIDILPVGTILAMSASYWANASAAFKSKWHVCDGNGGTPKLNNGVFLRGGTVSDPPAGGGTATLTEANLPSHTHSVSGEATSTGSNHTHKYDTKTSTLVYGTRDNSNYCWVGTTEKLTDSSGGTHAHAVSGTAKANASHKATPFDIVPSYYTVIYIMKVA